MHSIYSACSTNAPYGTLLVGTLESAFFGDCFVSAACEVLCLPVLDCSYPATRIHLCHALSAGAIKEGHSGYEADA